MTAHFEVILQSVGTFGRYQYLLWCLNAYGTLAICGNQVFSTFGNLQPTKFSCFDQLTNETENDTCSLMTSCKNYSMEYQFRSVVIDMKLMCSKHIYTLFNTVYMIGLFIGTLFFGQISDLFGRKWTTQISLTLMLITGFSSAFCTIWQTYMVSRFFSGLFVGGYLVTSYVLLNEVTDAKYRLLVRSFGNWSFGLTCFSLTAYLTREWKLLSMVYHGQCVLAIFAYCFVPESPRFLLQQNRLEETCESLSKIAKINGRKLEEKTFATLKEIQRSDGKVDRRYTFKDLFATRQLTLYTLANCFLAFTVSLTTYSLLFSQNSLGGNPYINLFIFGALGQVLSAGIVILDRYFPKYFGRKPIAICSLSLILIAVSVVTICITLPAPQPIKGLVETYLSAISNGIASVAWCALWLFSIEMFPTVVRNSSFALSSSSSRVGGVLAPIVAGYFNTIWPPLQYVVIGGLLIIAIVSTAVILPETNNKDMPECSMFNQKKVKSAELSTITKF